ncbi:MAG TPA: polyprenyl synthetase family protein [Myxococcota bacterium]|nr:polyprenyl synthetase family protein [Myxococcota bacterium]
MSIADLLSRTIGSESGVLRPWLDAALVSPLDGFVRQPGKRFRGRLVQIAWDLAMPPGSSRVLPPELPQVLELVHAGSLIVDDIEDGSSSRRGAPTLHSSHGVPLALNAGNALYFLPIVGLPAIGLSADAELAIHRELARTMSRCHAGQALDIYATLDRVPLDEVPELVESIAGLKTGSLMSAAARLGAIAAGAPSAVIEALGAFGCELGICLQLLDDLANLSSQSDPQKRLEDLRARRITWVWSWLARHRPREQVLDLRRRILEGNGTVEPTAAEIVAMLGDGPRLEVRDRLHTASLKLATLLGEHPTFEVLFAEVRRLEASYG